MRTLWPAFVSSSTPTGIKATRYSSVFVSLGTPTIIEKSSGNRWHHSGDENGPIQALSVVCLADRFGLVCLIAVSLGGASGQLSVRGRRAKSHSGGADCHRCLLNLGSLQSGSSRAWAAYHLFESFCRSRVPMPPRYITLAIIAFWLTMTGWLFYRDVLPGLRPGQAPPYAIDLVDEARFRESTNHWLVMQNGREIGYADTRVEYRSSDDTFKLNGVFKLRAPSGRGEAPVEVTSWYRVTRNGELREVGADVTILPAFKSMNLELKGKVDGYVREGELFLHYKVPLLSLDEHVAPINIANRGSVLNTMQPLSRLRGLHAGQ